MARPRPALGPIVLARVAIAALLPLLAACDGDDATAPERPRSSEIAFVRYDHSVNRDRVFIADTAGENLRPLSPVVGPPRIFGRISWSPDGRRLAFSDGSDIYVADAEAVDAPLLKLTSARVTGSMLDRLQSPDWSPDGRRIAYAHTVVEFLGAERPVPIRSSRLCTMGADGSAPTCLEGLPPATQPAWSSSGMRLAFAALPPGVSLSPSAQSLCPLVLYVASANGSAARAVTTPSADLASRGLCSSDQYPSWSPDGARLAFQSDRDRGTRTFVAELYTVSEAGGEPARLTTAPASLAAVLTTSPAWAPDGGRIAYAYSASAGGATPGLWVMNADGSSPKLVLAGSVAFPAWRPPR